MRSTVWGRADSMPSIDHNALIETDADRIWDVLKRFGDIATWHPAIADSRTEGDLPDGMPGSVRVLRLRDGGALRERLLAIDDPGRSLTYRFEEAPLPVDNYHLSATVLPVSGGPRGLVRWSARFDVRPGLDPAEQTAILRGLVVGGHDALADFLTSKAT